MRPTEKKIENLMQNLNEKTRPELDKAILNDCFIELDTPKASTPEKGPATWSYIMHSKLTKPLAAAVVLIAAGVSLIYWHSNKKVNIPPELAQMPVEKLLEIHYDMAESPYDKYLVEAALKTSLDKIPAREVLALAQKNRGRLAESSGLVFDRVPYVPNPVTEMVEAADLVVCGWVNKVELDVSDLKEAILRKQKSDLSEFSARIKAEVELEVLDGYPSGALEIGEKLILRPVINTRNLDLIQEGHEYLILLKQNGETVWMLPFQEGVYPVDTDTSMVSRIRTGEMTLDDMWHFMLSSYDSIHENIELSEEVLNYWLNKLQSNNLTDNWTAVEYFSTLKEYPVEAGFIVDAIERHSSKNMKFTKEAIEIVLELGDTAACERILDICSDNSELSHGLGELIPRLIMSISSDDTQERLKQYLSRIDRRQLGRILQSFIKTPGEDIEKILLNMIEEPSEYGIHHTYTLKLVWYGLAKRGNEEFRAYIEAFLADPENTDLGVKHYNNDIDKTIDNALSSITKHCCPNTFNGHRVIRIRRAIERYEQYPTESNMNRVNNLMYDYLRYEDKEFIPFLQEHVADHRMVPLLITRLADPAFVPVLLESLEKEVSGTVLEALFACGEHLTAIDTGINELLAPIEAENWSQFDKELRRRTPIIRFLGTCGDISALPAIEYYLDEEVLAELYQTNDSLDGFHPFSVNQLQQSAVVALARLGGDSAIPKLKKLYGSDDIHIKILAAVGLYYLGDDTGYDLLEHFINHTERSVPDIEVRWYVDMYGGKPLYEALLYLRSPDLDQFFIDRLRIGVGDRDKAALEIVKAHKVETLPIFVEHLNSHDRETRRNANEMLKKLTGQSFGFDPDRFVGQQEYEIKAWRNYVEQYLAENPQPDETNYIE